MFNDEKTGDIILIFNIDVILLYIHTITVLFLSMMVLGVMIVHAISILVFGMGFVVVMMMTVLIFPRYLLVMTGHRSGKMMIRVRMTMSFVMSVPFYIVSDRRFLIVIFNF